MCNNSKHCHAFFLVGQTAHMLYRWWNDAWNASTCYIYPPYSRLKVVTFFPRRFPSKHAWWTDRKQAWVMMGQRPAILRCVFPNCCMEFFFFLWNIAKQEAETFRVVVGVERNDNSCTNHRTRQFHLRVHYILQAIKSALYQCIMLLFMFSLTQVESKN